MLAAGEEAGAALGAAAAFGDGADAGVDAGAGVGAGAGPNQLFMLSQPTSGAAAAAGKTESGEEAASEIQALGFRLANLFDITLRIVTEVKGKCRLTYPYRSPS